MIIQKSPTCKDLYQCQPFSPEGTLGHLTAIFLAFLGAQAGRILIHYKHHFLRFKRHIIWAMICVTLGTILCSGSKFGILNNYLKGKQNSGWVPINKNLWTPSYVLIMASISFLIMALCYLLVDAKNWWNGAPFKYMGTNSLLIYCGSIIFQSHFPFSWYIEGSTHTSLLLMHISAVIIWFIIAYKWHQINFFVHL